MACQILKRLKLDNDTIRRTEQLIFHHSDSIDLNERSVRRALNHVGEELFPSLLLLMEGDNMGKTPDGTNQRLDYLRQIREIYQEILFRRDCISLKTLALTGDDLLKAGIPKGKKIGEILHYCLEQVLDDPDKNCHDLLLQMALDYFAE